MSEIVWQPTPRGRRARQRDAARAARGRAGYRELVARSADDPAWFWPLVVEDMGLEFSEPWDAVFDDSRGPEWTTWFPGGKTSIARNCVHRWAERTPDVLAAVGLAEDGARERSRSPSSRARSRGSPRRSSASASSRATASRSSCRCRSRPRSPRTPARTSARSRCRSSPASPRRPSRSGCAERGEGRDHRARVARAAASPCRCSRSSRRRAVEAPCSST